MRLVFRSHAIRRMFERDVSIEEVRAVVSSGEVVEDYPDDVPYPSRLLLGSSGGRPLHVVAAFNPAEDEIVVVTVYEPDPAQWEPGSRRRRE